MDNDYPVGQNLAYAGIDLHSSNSFIGILDQEDRRLYGKRLPNDLESILSAFEPFKESLDSVVVESTYNWYWLVDFYLNKSD